MSDRFGALKRSGRKIMASKMPGDREHRLGCGIFVILLFMAIGTALLFYIYHDVTIHHGFSWNAMDGSTPEPKLLHNTQTPTEQSLPNTPNDADPDKGDAKITLDQQQPEERTGPHPAQYVSWFLAALLGTILFLMSEVVRWYPKLESEEVGGKKISFVKFLPWYIVNLIKGPIIVLVIMWLLVNINLTLGAEGGEDGAVGVGIQFGELPSIALLAIAFMLGYYSRTARVQLDIIMKWILPTAWSESHKLDTQLLIEGKTTIQPDQEADYKLSTNEVATWKVTFCENVSSIFLWADTKIPPIEPVALTNLPDVAMVGGRFYLKVTDLTVTGQSGRLHLQATVGDRVANLNIEVSSAST